MTRLELIVQQLGKEQKVVPLAEAIVVGRSRRADLTIDDEEVGREQFRIGAVDGKAFIEGIGTTNQTIVDGLVLAAGAKRPLVAGATIRVGRTTFIVRTANATENARPGAYSPDATLVAPRPPGAQKPNDTQIPAQERTGGSVSPMRTMPGVRPGAPSPEDTGSSPPSNPASPPPADAEPEQTMQMRGGYRPGQAAPQAPTPRQPAPPPPPAPKPPSVDRTMAAPRPGQHAAPKPPVAKAEAPVPPPKAPPAAPAATDKPGRPTTQAVNPIDIAAEIDRVDLKGGQAVDVEARLHEVLPRLFVKCEGMKRRIRLMKARNMLGRAESVDVLLPNESVSEQHAEIIFDGVKWVLRDRGSTNGSFVDNTHLRGGSQELVRHSIIGLGNVRAIFLCNDRRNPGGQRRLEERAVKLLVQAGRLQAEAGKEAIRVARADSNQSIAELLMMDTPLSAAEWATAIHTARGQRSVLDSLRLLLERLRRNRRAPKTP